MRTILMLTLAGLLVSPALSHDTTFTIRLNALNNSGQTGTATFIPKGDSTKVVIELSNVPTGTTQPAHIHRGSCANLERAARWGLKPVKNGRSVTLVPASLDAILEEKTAINVHKSAIETQIYVACGDIRLKADKE